VDHHSLFTKVLESRQAPTHASDPSLAQVETPLVTVDIVVFTIVDKRLNVLLVQRQAQPYQGYWSIPGGFIYAGETLEESAARWLRERTRVDDIYLEQLYAFGQPERDPRARVITVAYYALINSDKLSPATLADGQAPTHWFALSDLPDLAFDHKLIVERAVRRLKQQLKTTGIAFQLLPEKFTLTELQRVYELILSRPLDKRNFRKKMLASRILTEIDETKMEGYHRPAQLYVFKQHPSPTTGYDGDGDDDDDSDDLGSGADNVFGRSSTQLL
jgi:8-oxo-dGTP diphosphatase